MESLLLILLVLLLGSTFFILYLNLKSKHKNEEDHKQSQEIANLNSFLSLKIVEI